MLQSSYLTFLLPFLSAADNSRTDLEKFHISWLKCWSSLLFTTFIKSVSVPMCSACIAFGIFRAQYSSLSVHVKCQMSCRYHQFDSTPLVNLHIKFEVCSLLWFQIFNSRSRDLGHAPFVTQFCNFSIVRYQNVRRVTFLRQLNRYGSYRKPITTAINNLHTAMSSIISQSTE